MLCNCNFSLVVKVCFASFLVVVPVNTVCSFSSRFCRFLLRMVEVIWGSVRWGKCAAICVNFYVSALRVWCCQIYLPPIRRNLDSHLKRPILSFPKFLNSSPGFLHSSSFTGKSSPRSASWRVLYHFLCVQVCANVLDFERMVGVAVFYMHHDLKSLSAICFASL